MLVCKFLTEVNKFWIDKTIKNILVIFVHSTLLHRKSRPHHRSRWCSISERNILPQFHFKILFLSLHIFRIYLIFQPLNCKLVFKRLILFKRFNSLLFTLNSLILCLYSYGLLLLLIQIEGFIVRFFLLLFWWALLSFIELCF